MKKIKFFTTISLLALILITCFTPYTGEEATITVNLGDGSGRAVTKNDILNSLNYTIQVDSQNFGPFAGQTTITISVAAGRRAIGVEGYRNGVLFAEAYTTEFIRPGQNPISIHMVPAIIKEVSAVESIMAVWPGTVTNPIQLRFDMELGADEWEGILDAIGAATPLKYVTMDLSRCRPGIGLHTSGSWPWEFGLYVDTGPGTIIFDPDPGSSVFPTTYQSGKAQVLSIILPNVAEEIKTISPPVFGGFSSLVRAEGRNVTIIGGDTFNNVHTLTSADFPKASTINGSAFTATGLTSISLPEATLLGPNVFSNCSSLTSVYLPKVTSLGVTTFAYSSSPLPLVITFGSAAPIVGIETFIGVAPKNVTIRVRRGATGYGSLPFTVTGNDSTSNWGNGFRGAGWNSGFSGSLTDINTNISLTIVPF